MKIMSSMRAYVGGEGLWSKSQKNAMSDLARYTYSHNPSDYQSFKDALKIPLGDKQARLELDKPNPNYEVVRDGFIVGGNSPEDINDMIFLYRNFKNISYMRKAIDIWAEGDIGIEKFAILGEQIHSLITTPSQSDSNASITSQIDSIMGEIYQLDKNLSILEDNFSATLGEASRNVRDILFWINIVMTLFLCMIILLVEILIRHTIIEVDTAKNEFVSLASHQLRTPITQISWFTQLLSSDKSSTLSSRQKEYLDSIKHSNKRMIELIDALLNSSRIDLGNFIINPVSTDIKKILHKQLEDAKITHSSKKIEFTEKYPTNDLFINVDQNLFQQIIQNLISNAIKYTPNNGKIAIDVIETKEKTIIGDNVIDKDTCLIKIKDSGIGIPQYQQDKIFTKLFRADNVKHMEGTGLGLYLSKYILERSGGNIWFSSTENEGSTFYVSIPLSGMSEIKGI